MKHFLTLVLALLALMILTAGCTVIDTATNTAVQWRYGTPLPTVDPDAPLADQVVSLIGDETAEPLPSPTPSVTPSPFPTSTPTATPTVTPVPQIVSYEDEFGRFSLRYPDNWLFNADDEEAIFFASNQQVLTTNNLEAGAVIFFFPGEANTVAAPDAAGILQLFIDNFVVFDSEEILQPVTLSEVGGRTAAVATADGVFNRYPVQVTYTTLVSESRFLVVVTMLADETAAEMRPIAQEIVESVRLP